MMDWSHALLSSVATLWYRVQQREGCEHTDTLFSKAMIVINEISQGSMIIMDWGLPWNHKLSGNIAIDASGRPDFFVNILPLLPSRVCT